MRYSHYRERVKSQSIFMTFYYCKINPIGTQNEPNSNQPTHCSEILLPHQIGINPVQVHQLLMSTLLSYLTLFKCNNFGGILDGWQSMCNDDGSSSSACFVQCILHNFLTSCVQSRSGLIQQQNGRISGPNKKTKGDFRILPKRHTFEMPYSN